MKINEIINRVESEEYSAQLNIASGKRQFLELMSQDPSYLALLDACKTTENSLLILSRIERLIHLDIDLRFENPHDVALAAYLYALEESSLANQEPVIAEIGALFITQARQIWWSRFVAEMILFQSQASVTTQITMGAPVQSDVPQPELLSRSLSNTSPPVFGHMIRDVHLYSITHNYDITTPWSSAIISTVDLGSEKKSFRQLPAIASPVTTASGLDEAFSRTAIQWR